MSRSGPVLAASSSRRSSSLPAMVMGSAWCNPCNKSAVGTEAGATSECGKNAFLKTASCRTRPHLSALASMGQAEVDSVERRPIGEVHVEAPLETRQLLTVLAHRHARSQGSAVRRNIDIGEAKVFPADLRRMVTRGMNPFTW